MFFVKNGDKAASPSELTCPPGWEWEDDAWVYDINRAVDERGNISDLLPDQGSPAMPWLKSSFLGREESPVFWSKTSRGSGDVTCDYLDAESRRETGAWTRAGW